MEGTHEAIIQKHDFDLVQSSAELAYFSDKVYLFSGILICGCCGCRMTHKTNRYKEIKSITIITARPAKEWLHIVGHAERVGSD